MVRRAPQPVGTDGYDQKAVDVIHNLSHLVRRLCYRLKKHEPDSKMVNQAMDYLWGEGLQGSVLRETTVAAHPDLRALETQDSISKWADETFGPAGSNARVAARANEEMAELLRALTSDDNHPKAAEEIADIFIVLYRVAYRLKADIHAEIDKKMAVNRKREWKVDGTGHGYHVPLESAIGDQK